MRKLKIGIIGVGGIAQVHIESYRKDPNVEIYAFCDINGEKLKEQGEKHGVTRLFTNLEEMVALPELDAVSVCTWNTSHADCTIAALNAGKHVLCEKPMAANSKEAMEMMEAAKRNNKILMIGFVRRFSEENKVIEDYRKQGYLGEIYHAKGSYFRRNGSPGGWFVDKSKSAGGPLIDLGVHMLDQIRCLIGNPKPVSVFGVTHNKLGNRPEIKGSKAGWLASSGGKDVYDVEDLATALIRFENGTSIMLETSFELHIEKKENMKVELFGTKGGLKQETGKDIEIYTMLNDYLVDVSPQLSLNIDFHNPFHREIAHFLSLVRGETDVCLAPAQDGVDIMKILEAIYESAATGHEVLIENK